MLIEDKNKNIKDLTLKLNNDNTFENINSINLLDGEKIIAINFISVDQNINHIVISKNYKKFHEIETQLYEKYPDYGKSENFFMFNGSQINRWESLKDNGIIGYTIILKKIDD